MKRPATMCSSLLLVLLSVITVYFYYDSHKKHPEPTDVLTYAYLTYVNKDGIMGPVRCKEKKYILYTYILCSFSNGLKGGHRGLWEVIGEGGNVMYYAINGKAKTALSVMQNKNDFREHPDSKNIDIQDILKQFAE